MYTVYICLYIYTCINIASSIYNLYNLRPAFFLELAKGLLDFPNEQLDAQNTNTAARICCEYQ